jgi:hypothetical protein
MSINLPPGILRSEKIILEEGLDVIKETDGYILIRKHTEKMELEYEKPLTENCMNCKKDHISISTL